NYLGSEDVSLPRLADIGYRRVEMRRKTEVELPVARLRDIAADCGMEIHSMMDWHPGIADADATVRREVLDRIRDSVTWGAELGARILETVPMWDGEPPARPNAWKRAVESYQEVAPFAAEHGVTLAIEPITGRSGALVHTLGQGVALAREVGHDAVRVMGDTHHMHYEEHDPVRATRDAGPWLVHFHFSDEDRLPPSMGHMDLLGILRALAEVGYEGTVSLSEMAKTPDAETAARAAYHFMQGAIELAELRERMLQGG
ncbi:MAG: sugar phosphate isomerase/epimerase, partial [Armatimonadota bacterium]